MMAQGLLGTVMAEKQASVLERSTCDLEQAAALLWNGDNSCGEHLLGCQRLDLEVS